MPDNQAPRHTDQPYGDLTRLNTSRLILDAVGPEALRALADDFLDLLGTSSAIYERNGDYALGIFSSGWCRLLDEASYRLAGTDDPAQALASGCWHCHESCWTEASALAMERNAATEIECRGGLMLYAVPILAGDEVVGAINFGHGSPPKDPAELARISERYRVPTDRLREEARAHPRVPPERVDRARRRLTNAARMIGLTVERHLAERRARDASRRYRLLFETTDQGVLFYDANGLIVEANAAAERILGRSLDRLEEETREGEIEAIDENGRPVAVEDLPAVKARRENRHIVGEILGFRNLRDGSIRWIKGESVPLRHPDRPQPLGLYSIFRDVTDQREARAALLESEERLRLSLQAANQGLYDLDVRTGETIVSPEYATMLGHDPDEFEETNDRWLARLHPEDRERTEEAYRAYVAGETEEYSVEFRQRTKDGGWKWIWSLGRIVEHDEDGAPLRMLGTHTDIDERTREEHRQREAEEQMRSLQKLESVGVLAGGIAHDFNNLLVSVLGNADLALATMDQAHPSREFVASIETASQRAAELCRQLLAYAGKGRFVVEKLDLTRVVEEMGHILGVSVSKAASIRYDLARPLPPIEADSAQIRQVVMNLITNASDAIGEESGVITVVTGTMDCDRRYLDGLILGRDLEEGPYAYVEVADTGVGMSEETRERIFDPFFTTKFTGRGLGLAATLGIVRGHRGAIRLYAEPGKGTTFKVLFPALSGRIAAATARPNEEEAWRGEGIVLVVDDEDDVRDVAGHMLRRMGFEVIAAEDGVAALERFRERRDEIVGVLLDLTMPRMGGEETFRELRRIRPDVRVVLSSGYNQQEVTQRFAGKGHAGFVQKPFTSATLQEAFRRVVEGSGGRTDDRN